jgi:hypothetical protein
MKKIPSAIVPSKGNGIIYKRVIQPIDVRSELARQMMAPDGYVPPNPSFGSEQPAAVNVTTSQSDTRSSTRPAVRDIYLNLNSEDQTDAVDVGTMRFNLKEIAKTSQITSIIEMELSAFVIGTVENPSTFPETLFHRTLTVLIDELSSEAYSCKRNRFHFECDLEPYGGSTVRATARVSKFIFSNPATGLTDTLTLRFRTPTQEFIIKNTTLTATISKYNLTFNGTTYVVPRFTTLEPHMIKPYVGTPTSASGIVLTGGTGAGNLTLLGIYSYGVTYLDASGNETDLGVIKELQLVGTENQIVITDIPIGPNGVTRRKIYRTISGATGTYYLNKVLNDNTTTTYTDTLADVSQYSMPEVPEINGFGQVTNAVVISGFYSGIGNNDNIMNRVEGHLVRVIDDKSFDMVSVADLVDFSNIDTSTIRVSVSILANRISIGLRLRCLSGTKTNSIMPV